ncbi:MAG: hypothetical protein Q9217_006704 [Psora testacea]
MAPVHVPESGLVLSSPRPDDDEDDDDDPKDGRESFQIMQLILEDGMLHDLIKSARHGGKGPQLSFGKTISLHYGTKSRALSATPASSQNLLYTRAAQDIHELTLAGQLSHKLALHKAQEDIAGADEALTKLQNSLASAKQAKQIKYLPNSSSLPPPIKKTVASLKHQSTKPSPLSFLKKDNSQHHHNNSTTRSMPSSPSSGPFRPPVFTRAVPTSDPTLPKGRVQRIQAIRTPLIHLLAIRPLSAKYLAKQIICREDEVLEALSKVGKPARLDPEKFDLNDRTFKELDVWSFSYPDQHDRELAIERAISALDRIRLTPKDPTWQRLLPKHERGKGKTLSKLDHLQKGPIQQSNTPRIHVQQPDESNGRSVDNESDRKKRVGPSDAEPMARSKSHEGVKKAKVSEKEAQSKRLLANGPKKLLSSVKEKQPHPAVKKGGKKANEPLSSEFVNLSDEEDGLAESTAMQPQGPNPEDDHVVGKPNSTGTQLVTSKVAKSKAESCWEASAPAANGVTSKASKPSKLSQSDFVSKPKPKPSGTAADKDRAKVSNGSLSKKEGKTTQKAPEKRPEEPTSSSSDPQRKASNTNQGGTRMKKTLSRPRNISSPHKPSPLGSSPPTNASDLDRPDPSSVCTTPLDTQLGKQPRGINGPIRHTSEHSLKRNAAELGNDDDNHSSSLPNGNVNGDVNGHVRPAKRHKPSELTPPSSDSPSPPSPSTARTVALEKAHRFKEYYPRYEKMYRDVAASGDPTEEQITKLERMHKRLADMKAEIVADFASIRD